MLEPVIVMGLGNPGETYAPTRHNIGFWVIDRLARRCRVELEARGESRRHVWTAVTSIAGREVLLAKPRTYMNRSGRALAALGGVDESLAEKGLILVYDDADLELGRIRVRSGGGAGGHNGVRSVIDTRGDGEFARVRLGVRGEGREEESLADYVLAPFERDELETAESLADLGCEAVISVVENGVQPTMNRFNGQRAGDRARE